MSNIQETIFARVENGVVVEYPVTSEQIRNRKAPLSLFKQVQPTKKPEVSSFQRLQENVELFGNDVRVTYTVEDMSIQEVLNQLHDEHKRNSENHITASDVPQEVFAQVVNLARAKIGVDLDKFAQERSYDNIVSLCSYATDPDPAHAIEAQRGVELRSRAWAAIRDYQVAVATGVKPVPRFESEIFEVVPALTWE